jgi:transposase
MDAPSQRELAHLAQASNFTTRNPKHGTLDLAQAHADWADKLARTLGVPLASVAPSVWHGQSGRAGPRTRGADGAVLTKLELARAAQKAVVLAQQEKSAWTRADVIKYLGRVLPRTGRNLAAAAALLEDLAARALRSEFEPVTCLEAPEPAEVPASFNIADGTVISEPHRRHRAIEFRKFLTAIDKAVPAGLDVHLVCDNYATRNTPEIRTWLARRPRFHVHFTPTGSSWMNQVERWFALLTDKLIRRGVHTSVQALENDIRGWIATWNDNPRPFTWTKTADEILNSLADYLAKLGTSHPLNK